MLIERYGKDAVSKRSCLEWFQKFKNGKFDIEDKERSGKPKVIGSRFVLDARRTYTYIRSDPTSNFISFKIIGNYSKTRKLGSILTDAEKC